MFAFGVNVAVQTLLDPTCVTADRVPFWTNDHVRIRECPGREGFTECKSHQRGLADSQGRVSIVIVAVGRTVSIV
jgi:Zn ribbon nucleic-acid-binding protein